MASVNRKFGMAPGVIAGGHRESKPGLSNWLLERPAEPLTLNHGRPSGRPNLM